MKRGFFSLRRLRWKLTLSYTLVTVVALLMAELLLVAAFIALLSSPILPGFVVQELKETVVPRVEPVLSETPPDTEALREEMRQERWLAFDGGNLEQGAGSSDPALGPGDGYLFVVDDEQRLLASDRESEGISEGELLGSGPFSGLKPVLTAALGGEEDPWSLQARSPDDRQLYMAAPVKDDDGRVLGAVIAAFGLPDLTVLTLVLFGVGAIALTVPAAIIGTIFGFVTAWSLTRRLRRLADAARAWSQGDFSVTARDRSKDELGQLSRELNGMAGQLENLLETQGELATLEARNRFARDLHDSVKQQVFATSLQIAAARAMIEQDKEATESHLAQAEELVGLAQKELNVLIHQMRPAALEGKGLSVALRDYAADWSRRSEILAEVHVRGERETSLEVEQTLFRVAQEALANVARHSDAKSVEVDLIYDADRLMLRLADDGHGFDPAKDTGDGFGLQSMSERLAKLGGRVDVESAPGEGTRVICVCPLDGASKGKAGEHE
jgi:two-component system, NarL family, sensor histidine kinase LiaS